MRYNMTIYKLVLIGRNEMKIDFIEKINNHVIFIVLCVKQLFVIMQYIMHLLPATSLLLLLCSPTCLSIHYHIRHSESSRKTDNVDPYNPKHSLNVMITSVRF